MKIRALMGRAKSANRREFMCLGGPLHGKKILLHSAPTLVFTLRGQKGRYEMSKKSISGNRLVWRKHE